MFIVWRIIGTTLLFALSVLANVIANDVSRDQEKKEREEEEAKRKKEDEERLKQEDERYKKEVFWGKVGLILSVIGVLASFPDVLNYIFTYLASYF